MNRNKCHCPIETLEDGYGGIGLITRTIHTVACGQFTGKVHCTGPHCAAVRGKVNHWFLLVVTRSTAFVCMPFTKGNAGHLSRHYPRTPLNPVCGFGCAQKLFEDYMHGERGKTFSYAIARSERAKRENIIERLTKPQIECSIVDILGRKRILASTVTGNPDLATLIEATKNYVMTPEEREAQRQSWVKGELALGTDADEAAYRGNTLVVNHADGCTCTDCQFGLLQENS